ARSSGCVHTRDAILDLAVDLPNGRLRRRRPTIDWGDMAFEPAVEARLVTDHEMRIGQHGPALDPDDVLVDQEAAARHGLLEFDDAAMGVPDVRGGGRGGRHGNAGRNDLGEDLVGAPVVGIPPVLVLGLARRYRWALAVRIRPVLVLVELPPVGGAGR